MTIIRIFRVQINPTLRREFEEKFADISVNTVKVAAGFISVSICQSTKWSPNEYVMISQWQDETSLKLFAGEEWSRAVVPSGMEKFIRSCSVHHYQSWV
jgi:quinol monooxygenase YgiN